MKILFIASPKELDIESSEELKVVYTGMGKINAFIAVMKTLRFMTEEEIMSSYYYNVGTCGSFIHPIGTILNVGCIYQGDHFLLNGHGLRTTNSLGLGSSLLCSDNFINAKTTTPHVLKYYDAFDMESFAIVSALKIYDKHLTCVKVVSDNLNGTIKDWEKSLLDLKNTLETAKNIALEY